MTLANWTFLNRFDLATLAIRRPRNPADAFRNNNQRHVTSHVIFFKWITCDFWRSWLKRWWRRPISSLPEVSVPRSGGERLRADACGSVAVAVTMVSERRRVDAGISGCHLAILDASGGCDLAALVGLGCSTLVWPLTVSVDVDFFLGPRKTLRNLLRWRRRLSLRFSSDDTDIRRVVSVVSCIRAGSSP